MSFPDTPHSTEPRQIEQPDAWPAVDQSPQPKPRRVGMAVVAVGVALVLMAGTGFGVWLLTRPDTAKPPAAGPSGSGMLEVTGVVTLQRGQFIWNSEAEGCQGLKGFDDIRGGTQVTVTDAGGKTLAVGAVDTGTAQGITTEQGLQRASSCMLPFKVSGVARGAGPYGVEVGHRGVLRYNEGDLGGLMLGFN